MTMRRYGVDQQLNDRVLERVKPLLRSLIWDISLSWLLGQSWTPPKLELCWSLC